MMKSIFIGILWGMQYGWGWGLLVGILCALL